MMPSRQRRRVLAGLVPTLAAPFPARSQTAWPERAIRIIVGYPPGQNADQNARTWAQHIGQVLGQTIYVENRPGANGLIGAQEARNARPDGYTWLWGGSGPLAINPALYRKTPYDPERDFDPVCLTTLGPLFLLANLDFPANGFKDLATLAGQSPGKYDYATAGNGSTAHLAMKLLESQARLQLHHVPYKGSPAAINDLISGQIGLMMEAGASSTALLKAGRVKGLAMTGKQRSPFAPQVPTLIEQGVDGFEAYAWNGIVVPAGTPAPIIERIATAAATALETTSLRENLAAQGTQQAWLPPRAFSDFLRQEVQKWRHAVQLSGAQVD